MTKSSYLIVDAVPSSEVSTAIIKIALQILGEHEYHFQFQERVDLSEEIQRFVFIESNKNVQLFYVHDYGAECTYFIIQSNRADQVNQLAAWLSSELPVLTLTDLQEESSRNMLNDPRSLIRLALGSGESVDDITYELLTEGMNSQHDLVRFYAVQAAGLTGWHQFISTLERVKQEDLVPEVREMARRSEEFCRNKVPGKEST